MITLTVEDSYSVNGKMEEKKLGEFETEDEAVSYANEFAESNPKYYNCKFNIYGVDKNESVHNN